VAKKPLQLTVIGASPQPNPLAPPSGLGEAGVKLWHAIHADYVVDDAGGLAMLLQICSAADSLEAYAKQIEHDGGPTIRTKTGIREHPLLKHQLQARSFVVRSLHRLGLDIIPPRHEIGRPAGAYRGEDTWPR
jgi:hypothetical protein